MVREVAGHIRKYSSEYSVYCKFCSVEQTEHWRTKKNMVQSIRKDGWSKTKKGWVCPECRKERD